jgi:hypothetical protein
LPRHRKDVFLPVYKRWDVAGLSAAIEAGYYGLPPQWDQRLRIRARILLDVFGTNRGRGGAAGHQAQVQEILMEPGPCRQNSWTTTRTSRAIAATTS